jgi:heme-degrading monooxygenase HmoA
VLHFFIMTFDATPRRVIPDPDSPGHEEHAMHVQIINFHLAGASPEEYAKLCESLAPQFAALPGLTAKVWLADRTGNNYGGVYLWESRDDMEAFTRTDLFRSVATHPALAEVTSRDFAVLDGPTELTRGFAHRATQVA